jgi:hypothetical protein
MKAIARIPLLLLLFLPLLLHAQSDEKSQADNSTALVALLDKSGYNYNKIDDGVYTVPATGKNIPEFSVNVVMSGDVVLVMTKLADRKDVTASVPLLTKILELNHYFDSVKLGFSDDMLYVRMDNHLRIMDVDELKYMIDQVANAADEAYPQLQPKGKSHGK